MRRMRVTCRAMPPCIVTAPPESPVPAPRGTTGLWRDLDRVADRKAIGGDDVVRLVDAAVHGQPHRLRFCRRPQPLRDGCNVTHRVQLKLDEMTGRERVRAAIEMGVADRPPVGAWGHTYREEWSPEALAAITVQRARQFGWVFVKCQPRASSFAEAFGSVYKPAGHRLK